MSSAVMEKPGVVPRRGNFEPSPVRRAARPQRFLKREHQMPNNVAVLGITIWGIVMVVGLPFWMMAWAKITGY